MTTTPLEAHDYVWAGVYVAAMVTSLVADRVHRLTKHQDADR